MELFYELLLTAAVTLLAAFLLATLFAANDPPHRAPGSDRAAAVDEVRRSEVRAAEAEAEAVGWVEAEKASAVAVDEEVESECLLESEGVPVKATREVSVGAGVEEEGGDVAERRDLTPAAAVTAAVAEVTASPQVSGADEAVLREVIGVAGLEEGSVQDVEVKQHDLGAEVAPIEVLQLQAGSEKQRVEVVEVAEVFPMETEAVEVKQHHVVAEVAPAEDVLDAGLVGMSVQAMEASPDELDSETAPKEILGVSLEKKEAQVVEVKEHELPVEAAPQPVRNVPLAEKEELKDPQPVEEAVNVHEEVQSKEEAKCEVHPVDQQEELVPEEESVARKTDDVNVRHEGNSSDKVVAELPLDAVTLPNLPLPEGDAESDMDSEEWEGIERSEVEKRFGAAASFTGSGAGMAALSKLDSDVQLQLQGLLKVAIDGPCYDSTQPLTLRPSSRAKWVAWQKLGNMQPEIAMEKYMTLLSETIPGWMGNETSDTKKHDAGSLSAEAVLAMTATTATSVQQSNQGNEDSTSIDEGTYPNPEKGQSFDIPAE